MNELHLLYQLLLIFGLCYGAFRFGKTALTCAVTFLALVANLFVLKQTPLFGFEVTGSDAYVIGSMLSLNLLREFYGKEAAKKATYICFFFLVAFVAFSWVHLQFHPSLHDQTHLAYRLLLAPAPRLLISSLLVFFVVQQLDLRLFGWISHLLPRSRFAIRSILCILTSQLVDTCLFSVIGLYGLVFHLSHIIMVSYLLKVITILSLGPLMTLFRKLEKT